MLEVQKSETTSVDKKPYSFGAAGYLVFSLFVHGGLIGLFVAIAATQRDYQESQAKLRPIDVVLVEDIAEPELSPTLPTQPQQQITQQQQNQSEQSSAVPQKSTSQESSPTSVQHSPSPSPVPKPTNNRRSPAPKPDSVPVAPTPIPQSPISPTSTPTSSSSISSTHTTKPTAPTTTPSSVPVPTPTPVPKPKPQTVPAPPAPAPPPAPSPISCVQGCGDRRDSLNGQTGVAIVRVEISQSGSVVAASIVSSSGNSALDSKAIAAARQMKFSAHNSESNQFRQVKINLGG